MDEVGWAALHGGLRPSRPTRAWLGLVQGLAATAPLARASPDALSVAGVGAAGGAVVAALAGGRWALLAALLVVLAGVLDGLDGAGAHFANVLPDLDDDAATGVRGLPHRLGATASRPAAALLMLAATVVLAAGAPVPAVLALAVPVVAAVVLAAGFRAGRRPGSRAPFRAVLLVAVVAAGLLVAAGPAIVG